MATETELERMVVRLIGDPASYLRALGQAEQATTDFAARVTRTLAAVATTLASAFSVHAFSDFDQAMTQATSIMSVTAAQTQRMREQALELSTRAVQGPAELAKAYYYLASAGLTAEQSIRALPVAANFATAGAFDLARATELLTTAQSALGLDSENAAEHMRNMQRVADVLARASVLVEGTIKDFSSALTNRAAGSLRVMNKDIEEGAALLAAFAKQAEKGKKGGMDLSLVVNYLADASRKAGAVHKKLGFAVFDGAGNMRNFADIVENLEKVLEPMSPQLRTVTLHQMGFDKRIAATMQTLLGTSGLIRRYEADLRKAGGTTQSIAEKQLASFANQLKLVKNSLTVLLIEIGARLAPAFLRVAAVVKDGIAVARTLLRAAQPVGAFLADQLAPAAQAVADGLSVAWEWVQRFAVANRNVLVTIGLVAGAIGVVLVAWKLFTAALAVGNALLVLTGVQQTLGAALWLGWTVAVAGAQAAAWLFNTALAATDALLAGAAILGAVAVVAALAAGFVAIGAAAYALVQTVGSVLDVLQTIPTSTGPLKAVGDVFGEWVQILKEVYAAATTNMDTAWQLLEAGARLAVAQVKDLWPPLWEFIGKGFGALWELTSAEFANHFRTAIAGIVVQVNDLLDVFGQKTAAMQQKLNAVVRSSAEQTLQNVTFARLRLAAALKGFKFSESEETGMARELLDVIRKQAKEEEAEQAVAARAGKQAGAAYGQGYGKAVKAEFQKLEGALRYSAEAVSHILEYQDRLRGIISGPEKGHGKQGQAIAAGGAGAAAAAARYAALPAPSPVPGPVPVPAPVPVSPPGPAGGDCCARQLAVQQEARDLLKELVKKAGGTVKIGVFNV